MPDIPSLPNLETRSQVLRAVREFFDRESFVEVETPVRIPAPALETHIDAPASGRGWLRTSPELHMKRLLAAGCARIYQMGPCFRVGECGRRHNPEFTLLEWYRAGADYTDILRDTEALLRHVFERVAGRAAIAYRGRTVDLVPPWHVVAVRDAFRRWAAGTPLRTGMPSVSTSTSSRASSPRSRRPPLRAHRLPGPGRGARPAEARRSVRGRTLGGLCRRLELANAYSELCDPAASAPVS
jgi:lysyl-tRNA synthetase class 2